MAIGYVGKVATGFSSSVSTTLAEVAIVTEGVIAVGSTGDGIWVACVEINLKSFWLGHLIHTFDDLAASETWLPVVLNHGKASPLLFSIGH